MVTRAGWDKTSWGINQRITVAEALKVNTLHGPYASFGENGKGTITTGQLADFVMLSDDLHTVKPDTIKDVKIIATVVGRTTTYNAT